MLLISQMAGAPADEHPRMAMVIVVFLSTVEMSLFLLEETKIDPNAKNNDGDTPLHLACGCANIKTVQLLVRDPRYNPLVKNRRGDTALHAACRHSTGEALHAHSISYYNTRASVCLFVCLSVQTITRAFVWLGASDSTRALLRVAGRSSSLSLAVCARPAKIRSLLRRHALVWAAILCAHAPRCNCDDLYPTGHVRRTGSY